MKQKRMNNQKRIVLCSSDSGVHEIPGHHVKVLPSYIYLNDDLFYDNKESIGSESFLKWHKDNPRGKFHRATPNNNDIVKEISRLIARGCKEIIIISLSRKITDFYDFINSSILKFSKSCEIHIVDSKSAGGVLGMMALQADKLVQKGVPTDEILNRLESTKELSGFTLCLSDLKGLQKQGKVSMFKSLVANALNICPIMQIEDGIVISTDKVKSMEESAEALVTLIGEQMKYPENSIGYIYYGKDCKEIAKNAKSLMALLGVQEIIVAPASASLMAYSSLECLSIGFASKL